MTRQEYEAELEKLQMRAYIELLMPDEYEKELIGIVKQLEGAWVIDTGCDAVSLWTEIEENEVLGNIYETPDLIEVRHEQTPT